MSENITEAACKLYFKQDRHEKMLTNLFYNFVYMAYLIKLGFSCCFLWVHN